MLDRYGVVVGETKWFGSEVYKVGESYVLTAGGEVAGAGHVRQRGRGLLFYPAQLYRYMEGRMLHVGKLGARDLLRLPW